MLPIFKVIGEAPIVEVFTSFYLPVMLVVLISFLLLFEFATNFYAELSGFADRQFY